MFLVFHLTPTYPEQHARVSTPDAALAFWNRDPKVAPLAHYAAVALVDCERLYEVYAHTNHIDHDWRTHKRVTPLRQRTSERSTSVGDLVLNLDDGSLHLCAPVGWTELAAPRVAPLPKCALPA